MSSKSGFLGRVSALQLQVASAAQPWVLLALRILFGYAIFRAGWNKLMDPDMFAGRFDAMGIPAPYANVLIAGFIEAAGGLLIMAGLFTRIAASALIVVMLVAVITAHRADMAELFSNPFVVATSAPIPFLAMFLVFATVGPGRLSLDHRMSKK
jgi:putative oxidoreductase